MKYIKHLALLLSLFLLGYLIYVAIKNNNLVLAGTFSIFFFAISYFGIDLKVTKLKVDANDTLLEVNGKDDEPKI